MLRRCVWSRNLKNEEALAHWGLLRQKKKKKRCRKNGNYQQKTDHRYSVIACLLKPFKHRFDVISFRLYNSLYPWCLLFSLVNDFGYVFPNRLDLKICGTKLPTHVSFFPHPTPLHFVSPLTVNFSSTLKTFLLFETIHVEFCTLR